VGCARVLCVDDEPFIRLMLADCIADMGLEAVEAENGEDAVAIMAETRIDLLITDIRLGGMTGWAVAEEARARWPALPIIYISGFPSKGRSLPGALYLAKPFRPHELEAAVRHYLGMPQHA
jgi:CheY-like chemotaxis protein